LALDSALNKGSNRLIGRMDANVRALKERPAMAWRRFICELPGRTCLLPLLVLLGTSELTAQEITPAWQIPSELAWTAVNGYPMSYRTAGVGTPIVLVHGSTVDYRAWNGQFDKFAENHKVVAVSLRHVYPEKWTGEGNDFSIEQHARDVAALIKKLGLGKVHLIGHSRGGAVVRGCQSKS
jgi:triacylglycerol esterase/lipase EstA (alpha/beta hydrolase family)